MPNSAGPRYRPATALISTDRGAPSTWAAISQIALRRTGGEAGAPVAVITQSSARPARNELPGTGARGPRALRTGDHSQESTAAAGTRPPKPPERHPVSAAHRHAA